MVESVREPGPSPSFTVELHKLLGACVAAAFREFIPYCGLECPYCRATRNRECPAVPTPGEIEEWVREVARAEP